MTVSMCQISRLVRLFKSWLKTSLLLSKVRHLRGLRCVPALRKWTGLEQNTICLPAREITSAAQDTDCITRLH